MTDKTPIGQASSLIESTAPMAHWGSYRNTDGPSVLSGGGAGTQEAAAGQGRGAGTQEAAAGQGRGAGADQGRGAGVQARDRAAALAKAATLIEALPWLDRFHGQTVVIKYGGHAMADEPLRRGFAQDLVFLRYAGLRPVVVHGGGPQISAHLDRLGVTSEFAGGLRVTTPEIMDVVRMVLTGQVNRDVVGLINRHGPWAVGMSGEDANLFTARRKQAVTDAGTVDIGMVGEITDVDPGAIAILLADRRIPIISSVARGRNGEIYNVNADTAAAALAVTLGAAKLVVLTDVEGLYADWPASDEVLSLLTAAELEGVLPSLTAGMVPKMEACLRAVRGGVGRAHVLDGRLPHALLLEVFTDQGIGTMVIPDGATP